MSNGVFSLKCIKGLPNWVIKNDSKLMSWSFYDGTIVPKPNQLVKVLKSYTYNEGMELEFIDARLEDMFKLDYDSNSKGLALVLVDGREQLYAFPVNKAGYLLSNIEKILNLEAKLINSGYVDYDNA